MDNVGNRLNCILASEFVLLDMKKVVVSVEVHLANLGHSSADHSVREFPLVIKSLQMKFLKRAYLEILAEFEHMVVCSSRKHDFSSCELKMDKKGKYSR